MKILGQIILILSLILASINSSAIEIPNDLQVAIDKMSFLASIARRCNTALDIQGKDGLNDDDCVLYRKKLSPVMQEFLENEGAFVKLGEEADKSNSLIERQEVKNLVGKVDRYSDIIFKVNKHIEFLTD